MLTLRRALHAYAWLTVIEIDVLTYAELVDRAPASIRIAIDIHKPVGPDFAQMLFDDLAGVHCGTTPMPIQ